MAHGGISLSAVAAVALAAMPACRAPAEFAASPAGTPTWRRRPFTYTTTP